MSIRITFLKRFASAIIWLKSFDIGICERIFLPFDELKLFVIDDLVTGTRFCWRRFCPPRRRFPASEFGLLRTGRRSALRGIRTWASLLRREARIDWWSCDDSFPSPIVILILALPNMRISLQAGPASVT